MIDPSVCAYTAEYAQATYQFMEASYGPIPIVIGTTPEFNDAGDRVPTRSV